MSTPRATNGQSRIRLISAGAGTGKTHRLVNELEQAITRTDRPVRPEAVIATTFTVKAAAELRERVRSRLLEKGQLEAAQRLSAARLGTVNSVCGQLVAQFAFDLGISPETQVLDVAAADRTFERALSGLVTRATEDDDPAPGATSDAGAALIELTERMPGLDWLADVRNVAARARENALTPAQMRESAECSVASLLCYLPPTPGDAGKIDGALKRALREFLEGPHDSTKTTAEVVGRARTAHARLSQGRSLSWWQWSKLTQEAPGKATRAAFEPVREAAREFVRHPLLREDIAACITHVFELAAQALEAYADYKREWGVMDFLDQEVLALQLLERDDVREMLREQVDLVLVDEFQDTSPLQLAVFLALARIAPESVWVGDQKQAIYGFRGTDPALMDTTIEAIVRRDGAGALETLPHSWRSRAELVRLTSDLFAPAFEPHGIPPERVRLEPAPPIAETVDALGPVIEAWTLNAGRLKQEEADALAVATQELLNDDNALVRDPLDNTTRRIAPRDVAVLCHSGTSCQRVARALVNAGIAVVRPRKGLIQTFEARAVLAALRLWVDAREPLAAAELGRLLVHPDDSDAWLEAVLAAPGTAFATRPEVAKIAAARARLSLSGPVAALDTVLDAAGLREVCLRWGDSAQRLANLDALRAYAHTYAAECEAEGMAATVAGLVAYLQGLRSEEKDEQATLSSADAVTVSTLHGAKGLEWPVTVLYDIDSRRGAEAFGVDFASDREHFDFDDPLGGRWIRYWPDPAASAGEFPAPGKSDFHDDVKQGPEYAVVDQRHRREGLRLLYVAWTRARDRVVLAAKPGKFVGASLAQLSDKQGNALIGEPQELCTWAGRKVEVRMRSTSAREPRPASPEPGRGYDARGPRDYPPSGVEPSKVPGTGVIGVVDAVGGMIAVSEPVDWAALGSAVHAFFAADRDGLEAAERLAITRIALDGYSVQGAMTAEAVVAAADALHVWAVARWPSAIWHREWPVRRRLADGCELAGYADLVIVTHDGFVLIDHKCLSGSPELAVQSAGGYGGQLGAYAETITLATGKECLGCYIHAVIQGRIVAIGVESMEGTTLRAQD